MKSPGKFELVQFMDSKKPRKCGWSGRGTYQEGESTLVGIKWKC